MANCKETKRAAEVNLYIHVRLYGTVRSTVYGSSSYGLSAFKMIVIVYTYTKLDVSPSLVNIEKDIESTHIHKHTEPEIQDTREHMYLH